MQVSPVLEATSANAKREFLNAIVNRTSDGLAMALQTANVVSNKGKLIVEFRNGTRALKGTRLMVDGSGREIPKLVRNG
jgi:hypothetical protein